MLLHNVTSAMHLNLQ